jgi:hypothetical protein
MARTGSVLALSLLAILGATPAAVADGVAVVTGTIDAADPTMPVVFISSPNCTGQGVTPVHYEAQELRVDVSGTYEFIQISSDGFASLYLMDAGFDPTAAFPNCLAADNGADPVGFTSTLTAGATYYAVPFDDTFAQLGGTYGLIVTGPGEISLVVFVDGFESGDTTNWTLAVP